MVRILPQLSVTALVAAAYAAEDVVVTIHPRETYQRVDGFGTSQAFQRGTQIYGADGLSPTNTSRVLDLLFSNTTGAGLTILRNGIGSSPDKAYDLMKTIEPVSPGSPNATPTYDWNGTFVWNSLDNGQLQLSQDFLARGGRTIYADAWSAPGFMKNNSDDSNGGYLCGVPDITCASGDWRQAYANYLVQYLRFYAAYGITIQHVAFLNEPDLNVSYASMLSDGTQAASFLSILAPTLLASNLSTTIACCDGSGWEQARALLTNLTLAGASDTLAIASSHGYSSPLSTPFDTPHPVWQTEWADLEGPPTLRWFGNGSAGEGLTWANNIQHAFAVSNVSAFLYWQGADNTTSNSALILLDGDEVRVSKRLWAMAQFARFVRVGARRVATSPEFGGGLVNVTAFVHADGSQVVQVVNNGDASCGVRVEGCEMRGRVQTWLTDEEHDLAEGAIKVQGHGRGVRVAVPARSMVSLIFGSD